jgi:hypothetical protein
MIIDLTKESAELIMNALAFTACTDVCADMTDEEREKMALLAQNVKIEFLVKRPTNFYISYSDKYEDNKVVNIIKNILKVKK